MDSEEALAELELEVPTSTEAIRRAYLRSVRKHPPEHDPVGFQRVREAYDLLRNAPWLWEKAVESATPSPIPSQQPPASLTSTEVAPEVMPEPGPEAQAANEKLWSELLALSDDDDDQPLPWRDVEDALQSLEDGKLAEARHLSQSLDRRMTELGTRAREIGAYTIARLTLVTELLALEGVVPENLIRALAAGVRSGDFEEAAQLRSKGRWRVRRALAAKAPSLHRALVAPAKIPRFRHGFTPWSLIWVLWIAIHLGRSYLDDTKHPLHSAQVGVTATGAKGQQPATGPAQENLVNIARTIDEAVQYGDCNTVREQWSFYARGVREAGFAWSRDNYAGRRKRALAICAELENELTEVP